MDKYGEDLLGRWNQYREGIEKSTGENNTFINTQNEKR